jgi:CRP-like cAMP-binding protein
MSAMAAIDAKFELALQRLVPINGLSQQRQQQLLAQAEVLEFSPGEFVFREGDADNFSFYILDGQLELLAQGQLVKKVGGGTDDASHPLARLQPRQLTARAKTAVSVLRVDRTLLDKLLAIDGSENVQQVSVKEFEEDDDGGDWMTKMLQSELFSRVPAANIQRIFTKLEAVTFKAGATVVSQDEPGDFYYIIQHGRCEVTRSAATGKIPIKLAELVSGDSFGEEALVSDSARNASVRMLTDGELMRLTKEDFVELIRTPLLSEVTLDEGRNLVTSEGAIWVDVRFSEEHASGAIAGSVNQPLNTLRMHAERLQRDHTYIVFCDSGARSAAAAFLLSERGFDVHCLTGGLAEYGILSASEQRFSESFSNDVDSADLTIHDDDDGPITVAALVPASHKTQTETPLGDAIDSDEVIAADIRAQALKAELAKANIKLEEAKRLKQEADLAGLQAKKVVSEELALERQRLVGEAAKAKAALEEAEALKLELAKAREAAQRELEVARKRDSTEAEKLRIELEATKKKALEDTQRFRKIEAQEAESLKRELEAVKKKALEDTQRFKKIEAETTEKLRQEIEQAKRQASEDAERLKREEAEVAEQLKLELEQARRDAQAEAEQVKQAALAEAERVKRKEAEEIAKANQLIEQARREKDEAEAAKRQMEIETEKRIAEEQAKLAAQAEHAQQQIEETGRLKEELELERKRAEDDAERKHQAHAQQLEAMREESERRLKERELELGAQFEKQANALAELHEKKRAAEEEIERQRGELRSEASDAKKRLAEAKRIQSEVEHAREESAQEAELREARQREIEEKLENDLRAQLDSERHKLEAEFARNAEELERARREREAAEAARIKAAEDAERIIEDYKQTHEVLRQKEQEKLREERERLEAEAQSLRASLDEAKQATEQARLNESAAEKEIARLNTRRDDADPDSTLANKIVVDIAELEAEVNAARAEASAAAAVEREVQAAAEANTEHLIQQRQEETDSRGRFEDDIESWLSEQSELEGSDVQQQILANQKAHLERIKKRAFKAREAAKEHDQSLIEELSSQLKDDDY